MVVRCGRGEIRHAGGDSQTPLFTIFGSVALLVLSDFPGNRQSRAVAYAGLVFNGFVLITLGTLVAPHPWLSVALMFVLGVAVTFSGVLSEIVAAGQRATLLTFVLPACTPRRTDAGAAARLADRTGGVRARGAVRLPAAPPRRAAAPRGAGVQVTGRPAGRAPRRPRTSPEP